MNIGTIEMTLDSMGPNDLTYVSEKHEAIFTIQRVLLQQGSALIPDRIELKVWVESQRVVGRTEPEVTP